jgi:type IV pilus assembly protein PilA
MLRFFNRKLHNRKGFTLIELIVVIAILAILALIAIPRLAGFTDTARKQATESDAKTITTSITALWTEDNTIVTAADDDIKVLAGPYKGATSDVVIGADGSVAFTYTNGDWSVEVADSVVGTATK